MRLHRDLIHGRLLQNYRVFIDPSWFWLAKSRFFQRNPAAIAVTRQNGSIFPNQGRGNPFATAKLTVPVAQAG